MARRLLAVVALAFAITGCVPQDKYNALKLEKYQLAEQLGNAQNEASAAKAEAATLRDQHERMVAASGDAGKLAQKYMEEAGMLRTQYTELDAKYKAALERPVGVTVLNPGLQQELQQLATQFPDLVELDAGRGILRLKSDVTFDRGSAELTSQARSAIARIAQILNSPSARGYEFLVAGHTDSTPVTNPATKAAGHKDNWYLSSHRAISVGSELMKHQVTPQRLGVAGYADQRPIASNATSAGQTRNRRVEVAILPSTYKGPSAVADAPAAAPRTTVVAPVRQPNLNKDTATVDTGPLLNK